MHDIVNIGQIIFENVVGVGEGAHFRPLSPPRGFRHFKIKFNKISCKINVYYLVYALRNFNFSDQNMYLQ